ncbi:biotin-dependent carboxyltransferase family protein [Sporomusa sp. KB1]|jgi:antagonist of KipI|uniref:5-oxoprolinase subunit C family protein n=1 Tax=Sporomusa sp. KB1 TaxID=943346 RepID=UPI0021061355|nr:biotin-dependent carboxyltransferase family protein [Sporomusa sp. KB1]
MEIKPHNFANSNQEKIMSLKVLKAGLLTSVQDLGRHGYQKYGVSVSGAMDTYALRIANLLVGNEKCESALEITLIGPTLTLNKNTLLAITGANLSPTINGNPVPMWRPVYLTQDCILEFGTCLSGCRAYLAIAGGYSVPKIMGSKSTYFKAGLGGFQGRAIKAGDIISLDPSPNLSSTLIQKLFKKSDDFMSTSWYLDSPYIAADSTSNITVRVLRGNQFDAFTNDSTRQFFLSSFQITPQSDRMGYRLSGVNLQLNKPLEMISEAIGPGIIQVPPDGNPIILLADRQTVGGYPQIAKIIAVDIPKIAQSSPGSKIDFQEISLNEAEKLYLIEEKKIEYLKKAIDFKM